MFVAVLGAGRVGPPTDVEGQVMQPIRMVVTPRVLTLGSGATLPIRRTLPERRVAAVGAWCLVDQFGGPATRTEALDGAAYPEAGLMTITWPLSGLVRRRDSLGSDSLLRHGRLALATAGTGVTVSDVGVDDPREGRHARRFLHGIRLAAALPGPARAEPPTFQEVGDLPTLRTPAMRATVLLGALAGGHTDLSSPAASATPLLAVDITVTAGTQRLDLEEDFEHAVLLIDGHVAVNGTPLVPGTLGYLPVGQAVLEIATVTGGQLMLLGGTPWDEEFILFWRLLAQSHEEIEALREAWVEGTGPFGEIPGVARREDAPEIPPVRLRPRRGSVRSLARPATA